MVSCKFSLKPIHWIDHRSETHFHSTQVQVAFKDHDFTCTVRPPRRRWNMMELGPQLVRSWSLTLEHWNSIFFGWMIIFGNFLEDDNSNTIFWPNRLSQESEFFSTSSATSVWPTPTWCHAKASVCQEDEKTTETKRCNQQGPAACHLNSHWGMGNHGHRHRP